MSHPANDKHIDDLRDKLDEEMGEARSRRMTDIGVKGRQVRPHRVIEVPKEYRKAQHLWNLHHWLMTKANSEYSITVLPTDDYFYMEDKDFDKLEKEYLKKV